KDEENQCLEMYGMRPMELMEKCGLIGDDVFYAHGIHFSDAELEILRETKTTVAHCPSSNMRLGSGICRVHEMLEKGINVSLGVDGSASNDSSDMLGEMRAALMLQRVKYGSDSLSARDVFQIATVNGAKALGYDGHLGKIKEGYGADIAVFDVDKLPYAGAQSDPIAALVFCGTNHEAKHTIVNGCFTVRNGVILGFDEEEIKNKANDISKRMLEKA
ncbi:MAG: amidohydrolase family protein, partial [Candidatus Ornithospirochaeta sp.]